MRRGRLLLAFLLGSLMATPAMAQPEDRGPCNAGQLVLEARRFMEANRPARVALTRLLRALNECPDGDVAFELNLYLAVALMHEGRIPEARLAADRAQANAWDDQQSARAGALQIALRDLVGEVVFNLHTRQAETFTITLADPKSLPPKRALIDALPKEKAFAQATFDAMIEAAQTSTREAGVQLVTVYLPTGVYRLGSGQLFRVGTGTTNLDVKPVERWPRTIGIAVGRYTGVMPVRGTVMAIGQGGSAGTGLAYSQAMGRRLALFLEIDYAPWVILTDAGGESHGNDTGADADTGELDASTLNGLATDLLRDGTLRRWALSSQTGIGWPVAIQPGALWLVPRAAVRLMWIEGLIISSAVGETTAPKSTAPDPDQPPVLGVAGEWAGATLELALSLHWEHPFDNGRAIMVIVAMEGGMGTGWIRGIPGSTVPAIPTTLDIAGNAVVTAGAGLTLAYRF